MARDPYIEQRLVNWGRWCAGRSGGGLGFASTPWGEFDGGDRFETRAAVMPDGQDEITNRAVESLEPHLQQALVEQFVNAGAIAEKVRRIGCHEMTFRLRVSQGMRGVGAWLGERERAAQAERERVEGLHRARSLQLSARVDQAVAERARTDKILKLKPARVRRPG